MVEVETKDELVFHVSVVLAYLGFCVLLVMELPKTAAWDVIPADLARLYSMCIGLWWSSSVRPLAKYLLRKYKSL